MLGNEFAGNLLGALPKVGVRAFDIRDIDRALVEAFQKYNEMQPGFNLPELDFTWRLNNHHRCQQGRAAILNSIIRGSGVVDSPGHVIVRPKSNLDFSKSWVLVAEAFRHELDRK